MELITDVKTMTQNNKTRFVQISRSHKSAAPTPVNPPIFRASTVLHGSVADMVRSRKRSLDGENVLHYGSSGTYNAFALQDALAEIEGGAGAMLFPTGLAAIAHVFISALRPGDHMLLAESVYKPARYIATDFLPQRGVECEFYHGGHEEIAKRLKPNTKMVYLDNPGSLIYDIQDVPAIAELLRGRETWLAVDNTWGAAGLYCPIKLGADISIIAITKYIGGHSDLMMGAAIANQRAFDHLRHDAVMFGQIVPPDDCYTALRGLRTVGARLAMHQDHTRKVITALSDEPAIDQILYPALETAAGHTLFKRDFQGANGLLSIAFKSHITQEQVNRFADTLEIFGLDASWGGYESLVMVYQQVDGWNGGPIARLHIGLEDPDDLIADLKQALYRMSS